MSKKKLLEKVYYNVDSDSDFEDCPSNFLISSHARSSRQYMQGKVRKSAQVMNSKAKKLKLDEDEVEEVEDAVKCTREKEKKIGVKNRMLKVWSNISLKIDEVGALNLPKDHFSHSHFIKEDFTDVRLKSEVKDVNKCVQESSVKSLKIDPSLLIEDYNVEVKDSACDYVRKSEFDKLSNELKDFKNYVKMSFHHLNVKFVNEAHKKDKVVAQDVGISSSKGIQSYQNDVSPINVVGDVIFDCDVESEVKQKEVNSSTVQDLPNVDGEDTCWPSDALLMVMYDQSAIEHPILQEKFIPQPISTKYSNVCEESNFRLSTSVKATGEYEKSLYISDSKPAENSKLEFGRKKYFILKHHFTVEIGNDVNFSLIVEFAKFVDKDTLKRFSRNKEDVYLKGKHELKSAFVYGDIIIKSKDWFHRLCYGGRTIDYTHIDVVFYYLRKRGKYDVNLPVKFTTTNCMFSCKVKSLYNSLIRSNMNYGVISDEYEIVEYILGDYMPCNVPWHTVDHVLIPMYVDDREHWVLTIFTFKSKAIYIYDSMRGPAHDVKVHRAVEPFALLIPQFLASTGFYTKTQGLDFNHPPFTDKALLQPLDKRFVDDLPVQSNADSGVFLLSCAEYFTVDQQIPTADFDIDQCRNRLSCLLWDYGRTKIIQQAQSEPELSNRTFKKKRNQK